MALSIGELVGYVGLDTGELDSGLEKVKSKLGDASSGWSKALKAGGAAAGGALVAGLFASADAEAVTDKLSAQLGLTESESKRIGGVAGKLYADAYGGSLEETSTAVGAVVTSIKGMRNASGKELQAMTADVLNFASAFEIDTTRAAQVAGQMITSGLAKDGVQAMDLLTKSMQSVPAGVREDIMDAADEYGPFMKTLGLSGAEAMGMLVEGSKKGMYGIDKTGDALKEFTIRSTDMSASTRLAYQQLGLGTKQMTNDLLAGGGTAKKAFGTIVDSLLAVKDPAKQSQLALSLFGTPLEDLNTSEMPKFLKGLDSGSSKLRKFKGSTKEMGDTLNDNAKTNMTEFWRRTKMAFVELVGNQVLPLVDKLASFLANKLAPAIQDIVHALDTGLGPALRKTKAFMDDHKTTAKVLASILTGVLIAALVAWGTAATVNAAKNVAAWVTTALASTTGAAAAERSAAQVAFSWVMMGAKSLANAARIAAAWLISIGPIALVIAAVVGLAILVIKNWDKIKGATVKVWHAISGFLKRHWKLIVAIITGPIGWLVMFIISHWDKIKSVTSKAIGAIVGFVKGIPGKFKAGLSNLAGVVGGMFSSAMTAGRNKVASIGGAIVSWISAIPGKLSRLGGRFASAGRNLLQQFINGMKNAAGIISGIAGNVWDTVRGLLNGAIDRINSALEFEVDIPGPNPHINPPDIPHLATGGRATKSTLAVIGEGAEPESVLPDSVLRGLLRKAYDAGASMSKGKGGDAPLIGQVVQQPDESADQLAERLWFKTRRGY